MRKYTTILFTEHGEGTGASITLEQLLRGYANKSPGLQLLAPSPSRAGRLSRELNIPLLDLQTGHDSLFENVRSLNRLLPELRASALIIHAWHSRGFELAWWLGTLLGVPATGTIHDHPGNRTHGFIRRRIMRISAKHMLGFACVSEAVRRAWVSVCGADRLAMIPNGLVDMRRSHFPADHVRLGFLGMGSIGKGFELVERWIDQCADREIEWRLFGDIHPDYQDRADAVRVRHPRRVQFCGRQDTSAIFSQIDVLIHASSAFDSFPTVLLESARAGIPAVASDYGGAREIIEDGKTGFLFNPNDPDVGCNAIRTLVANPSLRILMGREARRIFEQQFRSDRMAERYESFWNSALASNSDSVR